MKRLSLFLLMTLFVYGLGYSQGTKVFHENFELPSQADSVTATGPAGWSLTSSLASQGVYSDSTKVSTGDTNALITSSIDLTGMSYVMLNFDHICKVEFFDAGEIFVSTDNGANWTKLTSSEYAGNSAYFNNNGKFNALAYGKWEQGKDTMPDNSWWKTEQFDISSIAGNAANVKIKFALSDVNNQQVFENIGWFVDNISVVAAVDEINPPAISLNTPILEDTVYHTGPYQVNAYITDDSGIDTAFIVYNINGGSDDTTGLTAGSNNNFAGQIPAMNLQDSVSYEVVAIDVSQAANKTTYPQNRKSFIILPSPPPTGCTAPYAALPGMQNFDGLSDGTDDCGNINPLGLAFWENETTDETDWIPMSGSTTSSSTGPDGDHTSGSGHYLYTEASSCNNKTAILTSPCIDLSIEDLPILEFAYHMNGSSMGEFDVEIYYGGQWTNIFSKSGSQGNQWHEVSIDLSNYKVVTKIRFIGKTGSSYNSDMAIDDIKLYSPVANDAAIAAINEPVDPTLSLNNNDINVALRNAGSANLSSVDLNYSVNGGTASSYSWTGSLLPQSTIDSLVIGTENFSTGNNTIEVWTSNPNNTPDTVNNNDTLTRDFYVCNGAYNGVYSIGGSGADFQSIHDALNAIEICGVSGPVTFNIANGTYTGQYELSNITGASTANTITFQSQSGNATDVTFQISNVTDSDSNYVFKLNGADYMVFKNITVTNSSSQYATAFHFLNGADYNTIESCIINSTPYSSTSTYSFYAAPVYVDGYNGHNVFMNNELNGGTYGLAFEDAAVSNQINDNIISGYHYTGIYTEDQDSLIIKDNVIENGPTAGDAYGIYLTDNVNFGLIEGNQIHVHSTGSDDNIGISLEEVYGTSTDSVIVANNFVRQTEGTGNSTYGIEIDESKYVKVVYNTIKVEAGSNSASALRLYEPSYSPDGELCDFVNNNIVNEGPGYAVEISDGAAAGNMIDMFDYNNYYAASGVLMEYDGLFRNSLTEVQGATGQDQNSNSENPVFVANDDLHALSSALNAAALALPYITVDIDDDARDANSPDIGADEFAPAANDVSMVSLEAPAYVCDGSQATVKVKMANLGTSDLTSGTVHWTINGNSQATISFNDNLASGSDSVLTLGNATFTYSGSPYIIRAWLSNPNGTNDQNNTNDTLTATVSAGLPAGTYTIGGSTADFDSLNHAANYLNNHGICGAVTFEINTGVYEDQFMINSVAGVNSTNTITITSASGDSSDVVVKYNADATANYVMGVYNTSDVTIKNITVQSLNDTYGHAVVFDDESHDFGLLNNRIIGDSTTSTAESAALIYSDDGNAVDSNAVIKNNFIKGGAYGIYVGGESSSSGLEPGMVVMNNQIINNTRGGAYFEYLTGVQFENNNISGEIDESDYTGLEFYYCEHIHVTGNKVFAKYGDYIVNFYNNEGTSTDPMIVANNFFSGEELSSYAVYLSSNDYLDLYYNTMAKFGTTEEPTLYISSGGDIMLKNNAIINYSNDYAIDIYYYSGNPLVASDYNNLFTTGANLVDFDGTDIADLTAWQGQGYGSNSVSGDPYFNSMTDLRTATSVMDNAATPISGITTDIDGEARDASTPDIGADEYSASGLDLMIADITNPVAGCDLTNENVTISIYNNEVNDITDPFDVSYQIIGSSNVVTENITTDVLSGDTLHYTFNATADLSSTTDSLFEIKTWVSYNGDALPANDTMTVSVKNSMTPSAPVVTDVDMPWNTSMTIGASSSYDIRWYENVNDTVAIKVGDSLTTGNLLDTTTYYVDAVNGEGKLLFTDICHYITGTGENVPMFSYLVDDMIEITNVGEVSVDLSGYSVDIHTSSNYSGTLPSITLKPGELLLLSFGSDQSPANNMYGLNTTASVSSSTDAGYVLRDDAGNVLDVVALNGYVFNSSTGVTQNDWSGSIPSSSGNSGVIRVNADNNSASDWVIADGANPQTLGIENTGLASGGIACSSGRVPVTVNVTNIPLQNAAVADVISPAGGCGLSSETVSVQIYNFGYDPINGNLDAKYSIRGSSNVVSESVTTSIAQNDTITYTFNTPVDLSTNVDSNFVLDVWVDLTNDNVTSDDSTSTTVFSGASQSSPMVSDINVSYGQQGTFTASSPYDVYWYADLAKTNKLHKGPNFTTPVLYDTAKYYAVAQELIPDTLSSGLSGGEDYDGIMFDVIAKNTIIIDSFALNLETSSAREIEVYYANGSYEPIEENPALWSFAGSQYVDNANAQGTLTNLSIGNIKVQAGDTLALYIRNANGEDLMMYDYSDVKEDNNVKMISGKGVNGLFDYDYSDKGFNGELYYSEVVGCPSLPVEVKAIVDNVPAVDAGISEVVTPVSGTYVNDPFIIKAVINNYGQDTLTSVDVDWSIDGSAQSTYNWTGTLMPAGHSDTVTISTNTTLSYDQHEIKAWVNNPNGTADLIGSNDTSITSVQPCIDQGIYTIDPNGGDFGSFSLAADALNSCGINGAVTFDVATGTYYEQISLGEINGASVNDSITFRAASGNPANVTLSFADTSSATNNYVIDLDGTDNIAFRNMTLVAEGPDDAKVVTSDNECYYVSFTGNIFEGVAVNSNNASSSMTLMDIGSVDTAWTIRNNQFNNGYGAINFYGSYSNNAHQINISKNTFTNQYSSAVYLYYVEDLVMDGNVINTNTTNDSYIAIDLYGIGSGINITANNMYAPMAETIFEIGGSDQTSGNHGLIANNMFYSANDKDNYSNTMILIDGSDYIDFVFNTAKYDANYDYGEVLEIDGSDNVTAKNNILVSTGTSSVLYIYSSSNLTTDYNVYYGPQSAELIRWSGDINSLPEMQAQSGGDQNSMITDPGFVSATDLHITNQDLFLAGESFSGVTTDIDGETRLSQPTIGADEYMPVAVDAALEKFDGMSNPLNVGNNNVYVTITNYGSDTLTSADIAWEVNGVSNTTYNWTGSLATGEFEDSVMIGTHSFVPGASNVKAWVESPNGTVDGNNANDTISANYISCQNPMAGVYSVGTSASDFANIEQAFMSLEYCGVDSAVVLEIATGVYDGAYSVPVVPGASASNTIEITSATANPADVILQNEPDNSSENYTLQLTGSQHIIVSDMTIKSLGTSYGVALRLADTASYNVIENNIITGIDVTDSDEKYASVFAGTGATDFNIYRGNTINNGSAAIYIDGTSSDHGFGNVIDSNIADNFYKYGIYASYTDSVMIRNNNLTNSPQSSYLYMIRTYNVEGPSEITGNYIRGNGSSVYGIYAYRMNQDSTQTALIANNMVANDNQATGGNGIYLSYSNYVDVYYNTVGISGGSSMTAFGVNISSSSAITGSVNVMNNNFTNLAGGLVYDIDNDAINANMLSTFDYNNAYTTGSIFADYGGTDINDYTSWQSTSGFDANSVSDDPAFTSATDLHINAATLNAVANPISSITTDFDGDMRDANNPDIGADEFDPIPVDMGVIALLKPERKFAPTGVIADVQVIVKNFGADTAYSFDASYIYDGLNPVTETFNDTIYPNKVDTVQFTNPLSTQAGYNMLKVYTDIANDGKHSNDTLSINYQGLPTLIPEWSNDMEGATYFAHDGNPDIWERGVPMGTNINTSHSGTNVWMTDLDDQYPDNTHAYLYTPMFDFSSINDATLEFWHSLDTEVGQDGVNVEYSLNGGVTWQTLTDTAAGAVATNWYTDTIGNMPVWTGQFGWTKSSLKLTQFDNYPTPIQFRFYLYSSTQNNADGWAIDDFIIKLPTYPQDAGVIAVNNPTNSTVIGNQVNVEVEIQNFGSDTLNSIPVAYNVNGNIQQETWTGVLYPDSVATYAFNTAYTSPNANYELKSYTELNNDGNASNDTTSVMLDVDLPPVDAGVSQILLPHDTTTQFVSTTVRVRIINYGTDTLTSIPVEYSAGNQPAVSETWTGKLAQGDSVDYTFNSTFTASAGTFNVCAKTTVSGDYDNSNDESCKSIVATGMSESAIFNGLTVRPNPADEYAFIEFSNSMDQEVVLSLSDVAGNIIRTRTIHLDEMQNTIKVETATLSAGMYFINLHNAKENVTIKLVVKH